MTQQYGTRITSLETLSLGKFHPHTGANGFPDVCPRIRQLPNQNLHYSCTQMDENLKYPKSQSCSSLKRNSQKNNLKALEKKTQKWKEMKELGVGFDP